MLSFSIPSRVRVLLLGILPAPGKFQPKEALLLEYLAVEGLEEGGRRRITNRITIVRDVLIIVITAGRIARRNEYTHGNGARAYSCIWREMAWNVNRHGITMGGFQFHSALTTRSRCGLMVVNTRGRGRGGEGQRDVLIAGHWCNKSNTNRNAIGMSLLYGILINGPRGALLEARTRSLRTLSSANKSSPLPATFRFLSPFIFSSLPFFFFLQARSRFYAFFSF